MSGAIEVAMIWMLLGACALLALCIAIDAWRLKSVFLALLSAFVAWFGYFIYCREVVS